MLEDNLSERIVENIYIEYFETVTQELHFLVTEE